MEIDARKFYQIGIVCFLIIGFANFGSLLISPHENIFSIVIDVAVTFFNFALAAFFYYLLKQNSPEITETEEVADIQDLIKQVKENNKKNTS